MGKADAAKNSTYWKKSGRELDEHIREVGPAVRHRKKVTAQRGTRRTEGSGDIRVPQVARKMNNLANGIGKSATALGGAGRNYCGGKYGGKKMDSTFLSKRGRHNYLPWWATRAKGGVKKGFAGDHERKSTTVHYGLKLSVDGGKILEDDCVRRGLRSDPLRGRRSQADREKKQKSRNVKLRPDAKQKKDGRTEVKGPVARRGWSDMRKKGAGF